MNDHDRKVLAELKLRLEEVLGGVRELADELDERTINVEEYFEGSIKTETMREKTDTVIEIADLLESTINEIDEALA